MKHLEKNLQIEMVCNILCFVKFLNCFWTTKGIFYVLHCFCFFVGCWFFFNSFLFLFYCFFAGRESSNLHVLRLSAFTVKNYLQLSIIVKKHSWKSDIIQFGRLIHHHVNWGQCQQTGNLGKSFGPEILSISSWS